MGQGIGPFGATGATPADAVTSERLAAALTPLELGGLELFFDRAFCTQCHFGPMLSGFTFQVTGVPPEGPGSGTLPGDDLGREEHT